MISHIHLRAAAVILTTLVVAHPGPGHARTAQPVRSAQTAPKTVQLDHISIESIGTGPARSS